MSRLLLAIVALLWTSLAQAESSSSMAPFKGWSIDRVVIRGVASVVAAELRRGLASSGKGGLFNGEKTTLFREVIDSDVERIGLYLARNGYPYAEITPLYDGDPARRRVTVTFEIDAGRPVIVESLIVSGAPDEIDENEWNRIRTDQPFRDGGLAASRDALRDALLRSGYARATVATRLTAIDRERVRVDIEVTAGDVYVFDGVQVRGARADLVPLVRVISDVEPGDRYSTEALKRARYQLQLLSLFSRIQLSTVDVSPGRLDLVVDVTERPFRTAEAGLGYWTDDFFRVQARWQHRNLLRRGRAFSVNGFASLRRQLIGTSAWWPGIMGARITGRIRGSFEQELEESYDLTNLGGEASLTYRHSLSTTFGVGAELSWITVDAKTDDAVFEETGGRVLTGSLTWNRVNTDDPVDPTRGTDLGWHAESTVPGTLSETHYVRLESLVKAYRSPMSGVVVAARVGGGVAWPTEGSPDLLPNTRFFAGGGRSMRGYKRRRLGPLDTDGEPIGGEALFEASAEVRFPVWWKIRAAAFVDAANVWADRRDATIESLETAAGPAVMVATPVGPIRADLGVRLGPITDDEPRTAFHLSIGHPF